MNDLIKALSSYQLWLIVGLIVIILIGVGAAYIMLRQPSTPISTTT
ncbi:MAG: YncE family protein, partial [Saccharolobus sp.]